MIDRLDIHAFADGELSQDEMKKLQSQIDASPEATRELESIHALKSCLFVKAETHDCATLWKQCAGRLDELDRVKKAETFVGKYAWALCILLFVVILGGGTLNRLRGGSVGMGQVASDMSGMTPIQTPGGLTQPEQLQSWIGDPGIHLDLRDVQITGEFYSDRPEGRVKRILMRDSIGVIDLALIPNVTGVDGAEAIGDGLYAGQVNGQNCVIMPRSGCAVLVMGDRETGQLRDFALSRIR